MLEEHATKGRLVEVREADDGEARRVVHRVHRGRSGDDEEDTRDEAPTRRGEGHEQEADDRDRAREGERGRALERSRPCDADSEGEDSGRRRDGRDAPDGAAYDS